MRNVIIDIDDTLADLCSVLLEWVNERLDAPLRYEQLTRDHRESGSGEYQQLVDQALNDPQQLKVLPCRGALDAVQICRQRQATPAHFRKRLFNHLRSVAHLHPA